MGLRLKKKLNARDLKQFVVPALRDGMEEAVSISQTQYLTGPRPGKLGVITGRLRSTITYADPKVWGPTVKTKFGTNVIYGRIHELGGIIRPKTKKYLKFKTKTGWVMTKKVRMPRRPFLYPALKQALPSIKRLIRKYIKQGRVIR